jgi:hypothetical protein
MRLDICRAQVPSDARSDADRFDEGNSSSLLNNYDYVDSSKIDAASARQINKEDGVW